VCDLKQFRNINNVYGRQKGDRILQETATRMREMTSDPVNIGRITSNYFAMILHDIGDSTGIAYRFENTLFPSLNKPFLIDNEEIQASFTGGIAVFPTDGGEAETLYRNAEAALKKAKASNQQYLFYEAEMTVRISEILLMESKLRHALDKDQFVLHYQPKISGDNHKITGLEALIRWNDPDTGLVPPGKFIPILEETGMILDVGNWAIENALKDMQQWQSSGIEIPRIAVNVSTLQLQQKNFVDVVTNITGRYGGKLCGLDLEVTESLLMQDIDKNIEKLVRIRELGINIAIDDFGTGYSSLSYLAKLPVNALKIDRSFIMYMDKFTESMSIVSSIIGLAHSFKLKVIAEGVETEEQSKLLRLLKCDELQGFLFSKPLPSDEIFELLRSGKTL
jgi:diguanylate cyclase (GGDEF)-like protein